jgi:hypothetical protein
MQVLSQAEEIVLAQFHEERGDRLGADVNQTLPAEAFADLVGKTPGVDIEGALKVLVDRGLLSFDGDSYALTKDGYSYLYSGRGVGAL